VQKAALALLAVLALAGCSTNVGTPSTTTAAPSSSSACSALAEIFGGCDTASANCPSHWHATFHVYVPGGAPGSDGFDSPQRLDWASPTASNGSPYYNYGTDPAMSVSVHLHQSGPEQGAAALGPAQFHFEGGGKCVGLQAAFHVIDLHVSVGHLATTPDSPLAKANPGGPWDASGRSTLRFFLQAKGSDGKWTWSEKGLGDNVHYQFLDGEATLLAFGHYSDSQLQDMMANVPPPASRVQGPAPH